MKIYFTASVSGKKEFEQNYLKIVETLKDLGYEVKADHIFGTTTQSLQSESLKEREKNVLQLKKWASDCDLVVAEVSSGSINVGYEISAALDKEKPVLALHVAGKVPVLLFGVTSDKFRLVEYDLASLTELLKMYVKDLSENIDTRFNFFISPKIGNYLDWISKKKKLPRAVYLRKLIEEDMDKNKEYSQG